MIHRLARHQISPLCQHYKLLPPGGVGDTVPAGFLGSSVRNSGHPGHRAQGVIEAVPVEFQHIGGLRHSRAEICSGSKRLVCTTTSEVFSPHSGSALLRPPGGLDDE